MRKSEKEKICALIVNWEFSGSGSSDSAAYGNCAYQLKNDFGITEEDLVVDRAFRLTQKLCFDQAYDGKSLLRGEWSGVETDFDDELFENLSDFMETVSYGTIIDLYDEGFKVLLEAVREFAEKRDG